MLQKLPAFAGVQGPVVVIVMDGYGIPKHEVGSAIDAARKPTLDRLFAQYPNITLRAHGTAVGMPSDDDMGNSEVGHNAIGAGQVYAQGAALVANAIAEGAIWQGEAWQQIVAGAKAGANGKAGVLHFIGLFSDGNVHSHIDHLKAMVRARQGRGRGHGAHPRPAGWPRRPRDQRARLRRALRGLPAGHQHRRLRRPHRLRRRPPDHHHGPLRRQLADGGARLAHPRARRRPAVRQRHRGGARPAREAPGHHRPGPARVHRCRGRRADRHHRGRRRGRVLQLPRRPRDRDHPCLRRRAIHRIRPRAPSRA